MTKYRFKTKEEFITEYGEDWLKNINGCWNNSELYGMNYLFGQELPITSYIDLPTNWFEKNKDNDNFRIKVPLIGRVDSNWKITVDMIKKIIINYNDKKILVYD